MNQHDPYQDPDHQQTAEFQTAAAPAPASTSRNPLERARAWRERRAAERATGETSRRPGLVPGLVAGGVVGLLLGIGGTAIAAHGDGSGDDDGPGGDRGDGTSQTCPAPPGGEDGGPEGAPAPPEGAPAPDGVPVPPAAPGEDAPAPPSGSEAPTPPGSGAVPDAPAGPGTTGRSGDHADRAQR